MTTIREGGKDKAAGWDGLNCDIVRLLTEDSSETPTPFLSMLTEFINVALATGQTPYSWRKAIITMIPKKKEDGSVSKEVQEMRPISVLQEFGKIASKLLANRLGKILLQNPHVMSPSQRAFLKDGSTSQCLNIVLNVLEDFKEKHKLNSKSTLFLLAYDQEKAYDSVQEYTIRASLERFNFPELFISFVLCNLHQASSCFKTFYGPTREFQVETSVRQGDPLSPLVYICITDALHSGIQWNPIFKTQTGYKFSNDPALVVSSCGYADLITFAETWRDKAKCRYIISDWRDNDARWLPSVDGLAKILPQPPSTQFRYLGLWLSMSLDWSKQIQTLNRFVMEKAHMLRKWMPPNSKLQW